ncbi:unnamed protein product [Caenorhabditis bovis]|uniref:J domain-containing protein n=1 Tax=Caenorhabditis bovis TaxID=2654633 RepID=A0A8S1F3X0_9PELO|nr:unnamed protein product [Caenorhabditis bovis]
MLLDELDANFNTRNLYEVLHTKKEATEKELKTAYYRQSMIWHPDKARLKDESEETKNVHTVKFQLIQKAYEILADAEKRKIYDETGCVDDDDTIDAESFKESYTRWKSIFKKVTKEEIDEFLNQYIGSADHKDDIVKYYRQFDGDLNKMMEFVYGFENIEQIKTILDECFADGTLKKTRRYNQTSSAREEAKRKKRAEKEAKEAEKILKEMTQSTGVTDLKAMILAKREKANNDFLSSLEEKYAPKKKKSSK